MYIVENTATQLIIQSKRGIMAVAMTVFVLFSIFTAVMIFFFGLQMLNTNFTWWRLLGYFVWQPLSIMLIVVGVMFWNNAVRGLKLIFDYQSETVTIRQPKFLRMQEHQYSIYSIERMDMELMPEGRVFSVYLVTKAGTHLPLVSISQFDEEPIRQLIKTVRVFLNHEVA